MRELRNRFTNGSAGSFLVYVSAGVMLAGLLVRSRIHLASALPSSTPFLWQGIGLAQDVVTMSIVALLLLALPARVAKIAGALIAMLLVVLHVIESEAVIFFGSTLRPEDFEAGPVGTTIGRSMRGYSGLLLFGSIAASIIGVWIATRLSRRWPIAVKAKHFAIAAIVAILVAVVPQRVHRPETARNPVVTAAHLALDARQATKRAAMQLAPTPPMPLDLVREMAPRDGRRFVANDRPLAFEAATWRSPLPPGLKPNIVFIALENMRAEEVGAYGARIGGVTPNLDRIAREGIRIDHAYSAGTYTPAGELGLWYGLLPIPGTILIKDAPSTQLTGLPEILHGAGWRSFFWISSTDQTFFGRERFYLPRGFQMFDGNSFPATDPRINWGVSDRSLAKRAAKAMGRLEEPFAAMMLTVNNHHPYQLPSDAGPPLKGLPPERRGFVELGSSAQLVGLHTSQMIQTVHYTDEALGDFFALASKEPWFARTIFVMSGDHGNAVAPLGSGGLVKSTHRLAGLRHFVPLVIYSPLLQGGRVLQGPASQTDILPTLLSLLSIRGQTGVGENLFGARDPERPVFAWSEHERMLTIATTTHVYHCIVPQAGLAEGVIPGEEVLIDAKTEQDLLAREPAQLARFRRLARIYVELYSWVVLSGRS